MALITSDCGKMRPNHLAPPCQIYESAPDLGMGTHAVSLNTGRGTTVSVDIPPRFVVPVRDPTTWTITRHDGPDHLGLGCNVALLEHQMALITSDCAPFSRTTPSSPSCTRPSASLSTPPAAPAASRSGPLRARGLPHPAVPSLSNSQHQRDDTTRSDPHARHLFGCASVRSCDPIAVTGSRP